MNDSPKGSEKDSARSKVWGAVPFALDYWHRPKDLAGFRAVAGICPASGTTLTPAATPIKVPSVVGATVGP